MNLCTCFLRCVRCIGRLTFLGGILIGGTAPADVLSSDAFSGSPVGSDLLGKSGGSGWGGPWTIGGYCQYATSEGNAAVAPNDRLVALEIGASYRFTTRLRLYGAWYRFDFDDDERSASTVGNILMLGARATL